MNYRLNNTAIAVLVLLILGALTVFTFTLLQPEPSSPEEVAPQATDVTTDIARDDIIVSAKQQYQDGTHTIAGTVTVPTPCHGVTAEPFLVESGSSTVAEIRLTTVLEGDDCPSVSSDTTFRVIFDAPEEIEVRAVWDGDPVRLNLLPVAEGEVLDETFFFKG